MNFPHLVIALTCVMSAAILMSTTGIGAHMGGTPNPGLSESGDAPSDEDLEQWESDQRGTDSLIGMATTAMSEGAQFVGFVVLAPIALQNIGFSPGVAVALAMPIWAISGFFVIKILRGVGIL